MTKEYNIGDKVWWAKYRIEPVKKSCPICDGKLRVTLILGNGEQVETDCTYCERGFQQYGYIEEHEYVSEVEQVEITRKEVDECGAGRTVEYGHGNYLLTLDNISDTKEGAEKILLDKIAKAKKEDLERLEYSKDQNPRKYSWHVGYYQRMKLDALKTIERCDKKIVYFKDKRKEQ